VRRRRGVSANPRGVAVTLASIESSLTVSGTRELKLTADAFFKDVASRDWDAIVLPGGLPGAEALGKHAGLIERLKQQRDAGRLYGGICAAPAVALARNGLLEGKRATGYPGIDGIAQRVDEKVVVDGNCVTSQGPGTAIAFGLKLAELLAGAPKSKEVARTMLAAA